MPLPAMPHAWGILPFPEHRLQIPSDFTHALSFSRDTLQRGRYSHLLRDRLPVLFVDFSLWSGRWRSTSWVILETQFLKSQLSNLTLLNWMAKKSEGRPFTLDWSSSCSASQRRCCHTGAWKNWLDLDRWGAERNNLGGNMNIYLVFFKKYCLHPLHTYFKTFGNIKMNKIRRLYS